MYCLPQARGKAVGECIYPSRLYLPGKVQSKQGAPQMITAIVLNSVGTFTGSEVTLSDLKPINFFYGANGSGKTTISRVVDCIANHAGCSIRWDKQTPLQAFVYNRDFVDRNFSGDLKGVFTLGVDNLQLKADIKSKKELIESLTVDKQRFMSSLGGDTGVSGKVGELWRLRSDFAEKCWEQKVKHDTNLAMAFEGVRNNKDKFRDKLLQEAVGNKGDSLTLVEIEKRAATLFGKNPIAESVLTPIGGSQLATYAADDALTKVVVGRSDIDIAAMVNMLGISDWVRDGQDHFEKCKPKCPFCQQDAPADLEAKLNVYFDSSYTDACVAIDKLIVGYEAESIRTKDAVGVLLAKPSPRLELDLLRARQQTLNALLDGNLTKLRDKRKEPSTIVALDPIETAIAEINDMISGVNVQIKAHNAMVANLSKERVTLTTAIWRHLWDAALKTELSAFNEKRFGMENAIAGLRKHIKTKKML